MYKRKYRTARRNYRTYGGKSGSATYSTYRKVARNVLFRKSETKYLNVGFGPTGVPVPSTGLIVRPLVTLTQGTTVQQRIGSKVLLLRAKWQITMTGANAQDHIRFIVGTARNSTAASTTYWPTVNDPVDTDNIVPYRDRTFLIDTDTGDRQRLDKGVVSWKTGKRVINGSTGWDTELCFYFVSNVLFTNVPQMYGYIRIEYKDF